jgi:hypothetical protein
LYKVGNIKLAISLNLGGWEFELIMYMYVCVSFTIRSPCTCSQHITTLDKAYIPVSFYNTTDFWIRWFAKEQWQGNHGKQQEEQQSYKTTCLMNDGIFFIRNWKRNK